MSIRNIKKDHLKEHAGVELVTPENLPLPDHEDPLKFWTHHETENTLVDLQVFAKGEHKSSKVKSKPAVLFTGRPKLILQLAPAIQAHCFGCAVQTIGAYINSLRAWWRLLDEVELAAEQAGQSMDRVEDVRQLSQVHLDFVHRSRMRRDTFHPFYRAANATLVQLRSASLYWKAPESQEPKRHLPPEDQVKAIRISLKQEWEKVRQRWALLDRIQTDGFEPQTDEESNLLKLWQHFAKAQVSYGKALPTSEELRGGIDKRNFARSTGVGITEMRNFIFPGRWEAETAFHLCLSNTGWNPAVLFSLDVSQPFLRTHPRDPTRYILTGNKERAGGKEQPVSGLWKTTAGPGFIIRAWLKRIEPLREQLKTLLAAERTRYVQMTQCGASADDLTRQYVNIQKLNRGCSSVWLFVNSAGQIRWLDSKGTHQLTLNGKQVQYLSIFIDRLNRERASRSEVPIVAVNTSDFRDMFALYVWRMTGGNILALMRALNHAHLRTSQGYVDNNILNAERDHQARIFLDHLFDELSDGRLDITILAHLQRHGAVSKEMEQHLACFRENQRSRLGMACKDPFHPSKDIQPKSANSRMCGPQRCLICKPHAIILPESMSGIAMRVEELEAMRDVLPVGIWLESRFPEELRNGLDVLKLFPPVEVCKARESWALSIKSGAHHIPGMHMAEHRSEAA